MQGRNSHYHKVEGLHFSNGRRFQTHQSTRTGLTSVLPKSQPPYTNQLNNSPFKANPEPLPEYTVEDPQGASKTVSSTLGSLFGTRTVTHSHKPNSNPRMSRTYQPSGYFLILSPLLFTQTFHRTSRSTLPPVTSERNRQFWEIRILFMQRFP